MNMTPKEIERAIDYILGISHDEAEAKKEAEPKIPRKRGRKKLEYIPVWALEFYNPMKNRTFALISMCIKEDFEQSMEELALKVAINKGRPPMEALAVLRSLKESGMLGYYDSDYVFRRWHGEEAGYGLENLCG